MTNKTKMSNLESYTELSIQIATLSAKVDKLLELAMKPEPSIEIEPLKLDYRNCDEITPHCVSGGPCKCRDKFREAVRTSFPTLMTTQEWDETYK